MLIENEYITENKYTTPRISLSGWMYYSMHTENGGYTFRFSESNHKNPPNLREKSVTKCWDVLTILVGTIEFIARGLLGIIPFFVLNIIFDDELEEDSVLKIVVADILCGGAMASIGAVARSGVSFFKGECKDSI